MKRIIFLSALVSLMGSISMAADPSVSKPTIPDTCRQIRTACASAGFVSGRSAPQGKKLVKDCMVPLMDGKSVSGVSLDSSVVQSCKARGRSGN